MADVESKPARKKRSFDEKEINLLISQWSEYPCLFDKTNLDHKDQNKRADLLHDFSGPANRHDKSQRVNRPYGFRGSRSFNRLSFLTLLSLFLVWSFDRVAKLYYLLLYGSVSQGLGTTRSMNLIC